MAEHNKYVSLFVACDGVAASAYAKNLCGHDFSRGLYEREDRLGNASLVQHTSDIRSTLAPDFEFREHTGASPVTQSIAGAFLYPKSQDLHSDNRVFRCVENWVMVRPG